MMNKRGQRLGGVIALLFLMAIIFVGFYAYNYYNYGCIIPNISYDRTILEDYDCDEVKDMLLIDIYPYIEGKAIYICGEKVRIKLTRITPTEIKTYYRDNCLE